MFKMCRMYHVSNVMSNCTTLCIPRSCSWRGLDCHYLCMSMIWIAWKPSRHAQKCHLCQQCSLMIGPQKPAFQFLEHVFMANRILQTLLPKHSHLVVPALLRESVTEMSSWILWVIPMNVRKMKPEGLVPWITSFDDSRVFNHIRSKSGPKDYHRSKSFQMVGITQSLVNLQTLTTRRISSSSGVWFMPELTAVTPFQ